MAPDGCQWIGICIFAGMGILSFLLQEDKVRLPSLPSLWTSLRTANHRIALYLGYSTKTILKIELAVLIGVGFSLMQIGEWAAAIACWVVLTSILLGKALAWNAAPGNSGLTVFLRLLSAFCALAVGVVLITITDLRKPDSEPWTNLQKLSYWLTKPPEYPSPKGPNVHVTARVEPPSMQMCQEAMDRTKCLCPHPLKYELKALPSPPDDNYSTEVRITANSAAEPIYHLRIFAQTQIQARGEFAASPYGKDRAALAVGTLGYDPYSLVLQSTSPEQEFKIELHSAEGLGIICIEHEN